MSDLTLAEAAKQMLDALNAAVAEPAPQLTDTFAVPALLGRIASPEGAEPLRTTVTALGIETPCDIYRFPDHAAAQAAWDALIARFEASGRTGAQAVGGTGTAFAGPVLALGLGNVETKLIGEDANSQYTTSNKPMLIADADELRSLSRLTGLKFRYGYGAEFNQPPFPAEPGVVNVFACGRPPGIHRFSTAVRTIFGKKAWNDGEVRYVRSPTYGRGRVIEGEGLPLFQVLGDNYYQLALVLSSQNSNMLDRSAHWRGLLGVLARDLTDRGETELRKESRLDAPVQTDEEIERNVRRMAGGRASDAREEINRLDNEIADLQKQMIEKIRTRAKQAASLKALEGQAVEMTERLAADLARLRSHPGLVRTVFTEEEGLHAVTAPIVLHHGGRRYDLGSFRIQLAPEGTTAVWSETPKHPKGHHHPHVEQTKLECLGNLKLSVTKLTADYRFGDAIDLLLRWLASYNPDTTTIPLEDFPSEPIAAEGAA